MDANPYQATEIDPDEPLRPVLCSRPLRFYIAHLILVLVIGLGLVLAGFERVIAATMDGFQSSDIILLGASILGQLGLVVSMIYCCQSWKTNSHRERVIADRLMFAAAICLGVFAFRI